MLEYLLLNSDDVAQRWHPRLTICIHKLDHSIRFFLCHGGSTFSLTCWDADLDISLPVRCIALRYDFDYGHYHDRFRLLGINGLEYQLDVQEDQIITIGSWPEDLTSYTL